MTSENTTLLNKYVYSKIKKFLQKPYTAILGLVIVSAITTLHIVFSPSDTIKSYAAQPSNIPLSRKVFLLIYNPVLANGQKLNEYKQWGDPQTLVNQTNGFFQQLTSNRIQFSVVETREVAAWPQKLDGFQYTESTYLPVVSNTASHHEPDTADYYQFLNSAAYDICGKVNRGEIDELWIMGGPWFGFHESALATSPTGPLGFAYNGPVYNQTQCQKLVPIMGFSYERMWTEMVHDFGHRTEATMSYVYGSWEENRMANNWDRFGLNRSQSPNFSAVGCGSLHVAPNSVQMPGDEYRYDISAEVNSYCEDFTNYPNLGDPVAVATPITCAAWGCTYPGYLQWWFSHIPHFDGTGPDGVLNDWWQYIIDPNNAPQPTPGIFSEGMIASYANQITYTFDYSGRTNNYVVEMSTLPDMSSDVYVGYASGYASPIVEKNPIKWDKYSCGRTLYWHVIDQISHITSSIYSFTVGCTVVPTAAPTQLPPSITPTVAAATPTATPAASVFSNLSAVFGSQASFSFTYSGTQNTNRIIDVSTVSDMSTDVYLTFVQGTSIPLIEANPTKWDKYSCGRTLYWRVRNSAGEVSPIKATTVTLCPTPTPIATLVPTKTPSPTVTPQPTATPVPSSLFSGLSAQLTRTKATFSFKFTGAINAGTSAYSVDISTQASMLSGLYMNFATGSKSPLTNNAITWNQYTCGKDLYWRVHTNTGYWSKITKTRVKC